MMPGVLPFSVSNSMVSNVGVGVGVGVGAGVGVGVTPGVGVTVGAGVGVGVGSAMARFARLSSTLASVLRVVAGQPRPRLRLLSS